MPAVSKLKQTLQLSAPEAAKRLLGATLIRDFDGQIFKVKIVETEAYDASDAASHSNWGVTPRTAVMFGPAGYAYVYFTYGMHYCFNVVTGNDGDGSAVLIRAVEPLVGVTEMSLKRGSVTGPGVSNGPAKLCQALGIDKRLYGHDLDLSPLRLELQPAIPPEMITVTTRIGISKAKETLWRFYITGNEYVSKK
ncbi:DNA-3-methyladenine glycosylase [Polaromonas sp.]|nr:DNA-3-methyladenine glycosylase [Candidatus Saccharibacteria bacterium]